MSTSYSGLSNIEDSLHSSSSNGADQLVEIMEKERNKAFKDALEHTKASMAITKYKGFSEISKMINNS